ncbi:RNA methyltransferase [Flavobacteriales bacterium]|jgi:tRNA (guanosine-2'-O-)-methyltransferase|nr:RNA methyltransferase [Flavobacteriales bacterium]MDB2622318.1 RNA methyltransferase [Flavobacteriales bacterium]
MNKKELLVELQRFLSPERIQKFDAVLAHRTRHFTVAVENLFQSHNASAVMRNCDCFGIQDLHVIANHNQYELSKDVAMGAEKWVDMHSYYEKENNTQDCIDKIKSQGFQMVATTPHTNDVFLPDFDVTKRSAFFFGTERDGLSDIVLDQADAFVRIPMYGFTESYNISVSAALVLHDVVTRLKKSNVNWRLSEEEVLDKKVDWAVKSIRSGEQILKQLLDS